MGRRADTNGQPLPPDPYEELGVPVDSDPRTIRTAYLAKARRHHPDLGGEVRRMARLNDAYELLSDPSRKALYDADPAVRAAKQRAAAPWTGAAGPPPGRPSGRVLDFGIFAGWSLGEIARHDPGYLVWLSERKEGRPLLADLQRFIEPLREEGPKAAHHRRR
jgi:curved DNA-binding protein CbpA